MISNQQLAALLRRVAVVYTLTDDNPFRVSAYENAASAIETLEIPVCDLWRQNRLGEIHSVGPNLASHIDELFRTGKVKHFESELKKIPAGIFPLLDIRGVGPKTAFKIATKFKLIREKTSLEKLKKIIKAGKLTQVEGINDDLANRISLSLKTLSNKTSRMTLGEGLAIAENFVEYLLTSPDIATAEPLGSLRRKVDTVGDIDLAVCTDKPKETTKHILKYPQITTVISSGDQVSRVRLKNGQEVDVKISPTKDWGSLLQHYTGSKLHNIALRNLALEKDLSLSEHGIKDKTGKIHHFNNEESFYNHLKLAYIPPELRENHDEINIASIHSLPSLLELEDIKGDLHLHSDFFFKSSHDLGVSPVSQMLDFGRDNNYEYLGFTDHNPKFSDLTKSERKSIIQARTNYLITQYQAHEKRVKKRVPKLLTGLEIDIRKDGSLSIEPELIDLLDYAIISIHSGFDYSVKTNTKRIIKALSTHPKIKILGHPTCRLINKRPPIQADWQEIFSFVATSHIALEINASPDRLDLPGDLIYEAKKLGAKFIVNTDAHHVDQMANMRFGIWTTRRGWLTKSTVLNTLPFGELHQVLK